MDRLAHLNPPQRLAATTLSGPLLVLAGAGTGKTRVITYRMAELIRSGIAPHRILSVTFTNKAAREMKERTGKLLGKKTKAKPMVSTFHSFCVKVLRKEIEVLGYPKKFAIYDRGDQESSARRSLRDIKISDKLMKPGDLVNRISRWKMAGVTPEFATDHVDNDGDFLAAVAYRKYQNFLKTSGAVDFDDLLLLTIQLFREHPEVLHRVQSAFDHVQIDEYQDTNGVQFELIQQMVAQHNNLCVVGDDDQSIYGWRGADVSHILNFHEHFKGTKVVCLEDNYRCTDRILEIANRLVKNNPGRHDKILIPHKMSGPGVRYFKYQDETVEAESVVREISYLIKELNAQPRDFAVLFRTNEQPRPLESEFRRQVIPYVVVGGQSFFDRRETRDLMAYLKVLANPADEIAMRRIINTPARGIGNTTSQKLLERAIRAGRTFWDGMKDRPADLKLPKRADDSVQQFVALIERYRYAVENHPEKLGETVERLIEEIDYDDEINKQYPEDDQRLARRASVNELIDSVKDYVKRAEEPSLFEYLEQSALTDRVDESDKDNQLSSNSVKLMTLHAAKGLEFPRVYMVGMEEGLLPHKRSVEGTAANIAEERRLAYVGVTRAQDYLTLTRAMTRRKFGKIKNSAASRFLREMFEAPPTEHVPIDQTVDGPTPLPEDGSETVDDDATQTDESVGAAPEQGVENETVGTETEADTQTANDDAPHAEAEPSPDLSATEDRQEAVPVSTESQSVDPSAMVSGEAEAVVPSPDQDATSSIDTVNIVDDAQTIKGDATEAEPIEAATADADVPDTPDVRFDTPHAAQDASATQPAQPYDEQALNNAAEPAKTPPWQIADAADPTLD
ncbi:UvrD-helicase domain-containing protein [bacterium]|nr:UvrD-helicase domain-containing protein [bacterium]